jgi:Protein of unknown function (DUF2924)
MGRPRKAPDTAAVTDVIAARLAQLADLDSQDLRRAWTRLTDTPAPKVSPAILRLALGYEIQARAFGGLSRATLQRLDQIVAGQSRTRATAPGMRLIREWNNVVHIVTIDEAGTIGWNDRKWRSLSQVARAITGTNWSGPAFFGLKQKIAA